MRNVDWTSVRRQFLLPPGEVYLNAGTMSALPRPVYERQIALMASAERNPTLIGAMRGKRPLWEVHRRLGDYLGVAPRDLVLHFNVTHALNQALACLPWPRGGEILASDLEYGSIGMAARATCLRCGMAFRRFEMPPRPDTEEAMVRAVVDALSPRTAGVILSHVTCDNGLVTPVARIAAALRERGVRFIVDGAHAVGLVPLRLGETDIALYAGHLHTWFLGPRGTAFLYVARHLQERMAPHIVGFGGAPGVEPSRPEGSAPEEGDFPGMFRLQGTLDWSAFHAIPAALAFREEIGEARIRARIAELDAYARRRLEGDLGLTSLSPRPEFHAGLLAFELPQEAGRAFRPTHVPHGLAAQFHERTGITIAIGGTPGERMRIRVSPHIWNSEEDLDRLCAALRPLWSR